MKKFLAVGAALLALGAAVALVTPVKSARAELSVAQVPVHSLVWESLGVAAGAVINSPVFPLTTTRECQAVADNSAGGSTRNLIVNWIGADGTTVLYSQSSPITTGLRLIVVISPTASTASLPTGVIVIPAATGRRMSFSLSTAGAAAGSLAVYCRS